MAITISQVYCIMILKRRLQAILRAGVIGLAGGFAIQNASRNERRMTAFYHAPAGRLHGRQRTPRGNALLTISMSAMVSDVTKPARRPPASTTPTAGAAFS